ncbi:MULTISPECIES: SLAP domain-containing protein [Sporosarcina]|uniref:SLAP domain-containing protein n=2 Tax=Sporosarcina newyorkensis TaxID=759851 RepID=A0A1T4YSN6_9BACL|nr:MULTISPECIES: SLAP domain-containing protein [Sporosarcina]EGQ26177.1 hypothetical protein HMPREF9372_1850 [Sporosarcina newyorkensis 2681]MBY0223054.1 SLAP domain-containing protein [Sporosarcina aquimarina]SKB04291.1 SLAP domain-containing protein [Sporosarcina newyorkensis]
MQVVFEETWEDTLSDQQKQAFIHQYKTKKPVHKGFTASPILMKRKRDGGFVATVFLQNNRSSLLSIREVTATVLNEQEEVIAQDKFVLTLDVPPYTATPWSFVFSPENVQSVDEPSDSWRLLVK